VKAADEEVGRAHVRMSQIVWRIAETPAEGTTGVWIKLAACQGEREWMQEPAIELVASAYKTLSRLTGGGDIVAEVNW
jgi:hypothetical protein